MTRRTVAVLCAVLAAATVKAEAEDFFYSTAGGGTKLFAIKVSGEKVTIPTTPDIVKPLPGGCLSLARSPYGVLYSVCGPLFGTQYLATIDPNTGIVTQVGTVTVNGMLMPLAVMALAFAPDGVLYAVGDCNRGVVNGVQQCGGGPTDSNYNSLYIVDVTGPYAGAFTPVGPTGAPQFFMDLAFDRNGNLFGVTSDLNPSAIPAILYRINTMIGKATFITNLVGSARVMGLAFGEEGKLYGTDFVQNSGLYLIDMKTGFERAIAALPFPNSSGLELAPPRAQSDDRSK